MDTTKIRKPIKEIINKVLAIIGLVVFVLIFVFGIIYAIPNSNMYRFEEPRLEESLRP